MLFIVQTVQYLLVRLREKTLSAFSAPRFLLSLIFTNAVLIDAVIYRRGFCCRAVIVVARFLLSLFLLALIYAGAVLADAVNYRRG